MAHTLGSTKLLRGQLNPGIGVSWISPSSCSIGRPLPAQSCPHFLLCSSAHSPAAEECGDEVTKVRRRELPWQVRDENPAGLPAFGNPAPQRTPWDRIAPKTLTSKADRFPKRENGSHLVNIVEKLRAIEHKQLARSYSTYVVPTSISTPRTEDTHIVSSVDDSETKSVAEHQQQPPKLPCLAELTIPDVELRRLQRIALRITNPIKVGYLGVTKAVVQDIHRRWQRCEIVKIKCDGPAAINMKHTHEELETKTGGLVIWRTGGMAVVYRGKGYFARVENNTLAVMNKYNRRKKNLEEAVRIQEENLDRDYSQSPEDDQFDSEVPTTTAIPHQTKGDDLEDEYVNEIDALLEELGPRYDDWMGTRPIPVDGDLLHPVVRGYRPPLRLLPYKVKPHLTNMELTVLRRLAKPLPPHFVLGRNRGLQGLAAAILKLWQKSEIVKIGVKRGVQNTRNQLMAEELERLTGGLLLSRDKFFITIYRGKDFLPSSVADVLKEREAHIKELVEREDRLRISDGSKVSSEMKPSASGSFAESMQMRNEWDAKRTKQDSEMERNATILALRVREQKRLEAKLATAISKKRKADLQTAKLEHSLLKSEYPQDRETITDEERYMFRKLGLRMDAFLLIGRRGIFDGVIENIHLHWKHRELVKLILKEKDKEVATEVARMLELESGGVLVAVATTSKGQAIIVYRGKNYQRPAELRPRTLLTKRKALARSKELQRKAALKIHIEKLETLILKLRKDYDYLLQSNSLPDTPHSALYKEIDVEYKEGKGEGDRDLLSDASEDDMSFSDEAHSEEDSDSESHDSEMEKEQEFENQEESEWDLESEDEEDK